MDSIYDPKVEEQYIYEGTLRSLEQMVKEADSIAQLGENAIKRLQDEEASGSKHLVPAELFMSTIRGLRSDEIEPFVYTVAMRKGEKTLSESEAISLIKEADFASNIPKNPNLENLI